MTILSIITGWQQAKLMLLVWYEGWFLFHTTASFHALLLNICYYMYFTIFSCLFIAEKRVNPLILRVFL